MFVRFAILSISWYDRLMHEKIVPTASVRGFRYPVTYSSPELANCPANARCRSYCEDRFWKNSGLLVARVPSTAKQPAHASSEPVCLGACAHKGTRQPDPRGGCEVWEILQGYDHCKYACLLCISILVYSHA